MRYPGHRIVVAVELASRIGYREAAERLDLPAAAVLRWYRRARVASSKGKLWPPAGAAAPGSGWRETAVRPNWRVLHRRYGPGLVDSTGTARRLQALRAVGWRLTDLAPLLELSPSRVSQLSRRVTPALQRDTVEAVRRLYVSLSGRDGPHERCERFAPPEAWDDEDIDDPRARPCTEPAEEPDWVVVERLAAGRWEGLSPTLAERKAAFRVLAKRGANYPTIRERLRVDDRQIARWWEYLRREAA